MSPNIIKLNDLNIDLYKKFKINYTNKKACNTKPPPKFLTLKMQGKTFLAQTKSNPSTDLKIKMKKMNTKIKLYFHKAMEKSKKEYYPWKQ